MRTPQEEKQHKRKSKIQKALVGGGVALAVLAGLEVAFRVLADGHPNEAWRLGFLAASMGLGAVAAALRSSSAAVVLLAVGAAGGAEAADAQRQYNVTIASSACPTGTPGLLSDGKEPGLSLDSLRAYNVTVCPANGQTFTGVGGWKACVFRRTPGPNKWALAHQFFLDMEDDGRGNTVTSTEDNPCVTFWDVEVGVWDADLVYVYPTTDLGVSGGTAVSVYLEGSRRPL